MIENRYFRKLNMRNLKPLVGTIHELSLRFRSKIQELVLRFRSKIHKLFLRFRRCLMMTQLVSLL
ncbi:hypothetical protein [Microcystis viridis]|uniref:hypothetical protein n=1 Tax=Microcystis viridis TaxID=44822 RepID=UPI000F7864BB|nr:hypothetical protein [Microcystis viridis]